MPTWLLSLLHQILNGIMTMAPMSTSLMISPISTCMLRSTMAMTRSELAMGKVCTFQILVVDSYPLHHVTFTYFLSFMFLRYRKILSLLINSQVITMSLLNSILLFSVLRTFELGSSSSKARVNLASIHGHPLLLPCPEVLLPSLVKRFP
jgi:hypothetical protein